MRSRRVGGDARSSGVSRAVARTAAAAGHDGDCHDGRGHVHSRSCHGLALSEMSWMFVDQEDGSPIGGPVGRAGQGLHLVQVATEQVIGQDGRGRMNGAWRVQGILGSLNLAEQLRANRAGAEVGHRVRGEMDERALHGDDGQSVFDGSGQPAPPGTEARAAPPPTTAIAMATATAVRTRRRAGPAPGTATVPRMKGLSDLIWCDRTCPGPSGMRNRDGNHNLIVRRWLG